MILREQLGIVHGKICLQGRTEKGGNVVVSRVSLTEWGE